MRVLVQRVTRAKVTVDARIISEIGPGLLLLVGICHDDSFTESAFLANKIANLRIFEDDAGNMNLSALDLIQGGAIPADMLVVSQFTLYADTRRGRRPSFINAARPDHAEPLVQHFGAQLEALGLHVQRGEFGAEMAVELVNDGPVTIWLDSSELRA